MIYGSVSLDLNFSRSETLTQEYTRQGQDGYQSVRRQLTRQFDAGLSLDFSFLSTFDGAAEKMSKLDPSVFQKWSATDFQPVDLQYNVAGAKARSGRWAARLHAGDNNAFTWRHVQPPCQLWSNVIYRHPKGASPFFR